MKTLSLANAIKLMVAIGVIAVFAAVVQSCESKIPQLSEKKIDVRPYKTGSLKRLRVMPSPPIQPNSIFVNGQEEALQLSDLKGKYVLLNVWATWCPPCVVEMPSLNRLAQTYNGEDFVVMTISMDKDDESIARFFAENDLDHLTRWRDPYFNLAGKLEERGLPITVFYDKGGQEIARLSGEADWDSEEAIGLIKAILGETDDGSGT